MIKQFWKSISGDTLEFVFNRMNGDLSVYDRVGTEFEFAIKESILNALLNFSPVYHRTEPQALKESIKYLEWVIESKRGELECQKNLAERFRVSWDKTVEEKKALEGEIEKLKDCLKRENALYSETWGKLENMAVDNAYLGYRLKDHQYLESRVLQLMDEIEREQRKYDNAIWFTKKIIAIMGESEENVKKLNFFLKWNNSFNIIKGAVLKEKNRKISELLRDVELRKAVVDQFQDDKEKLAKENEGLKEMIKFWRDAAESWRDSATFWEERSSIYKKENAALKKAIADNICDAAKDRDYYYQGLISNKDAEIRELKARIALMEAVQGLAEFCHVYGGNSKKTTKTESV